MTRTTFEERRRLESLDPAALEEHQITRLNGLLDQILPANPFYADKLADIQRPLRSLDDLRNFPSLSRKTCWARRRTARWRIT